MVKEYVLFDLGLFMISLQKGFRQDATVCIWFGLFVFPAIKPWPIRKIFFEATREIRKYSFLPVDLPLVLSSYCTRLKNFSVLRFKNTDR